MTKKIGSTKAQTYTLSNVLDGIKIDKLRDILIIEKTEGNVFLKGAKVYCGCCGKPIGEMKKNLTMPFKPHAFLDTLKNKSVEWMLFGLRHKTCHHTMFPFKKYFGFITLENYNKQICISETQLKQNDTNLKPRR